MSGISHSDYMRLALDQAMQGVGRTSPNPPVGAVVVKDGQVVGRGFHPRAGEPHAEVFALRSAGRHASGASIYVTLEPCSHHGRTPPCADALIAAGVREVFIGAVDPNPQVAGRGIARIEAAGIRVEVGILEAECRRLIAPFAKHIRTGLPFTVYKAAMTLDGATATCLGDSRWVSSGESRHHVHRLRNRVDAIMVGINTVVNDDPLLNTRLPDEDGKDPLRVVVDSQLRMPANSKMLHMSSAAGTIVATVSTDQEKRKALEDQGAEVLVLKAREGRVDLAALWQELGRRNIQRLLLEGGATLATAALDAGLVDQLMIYVAPKILAGRSPNGIFSGAGKDKMAEALELSDLRYRQVGPDLLITGDLQSCLPD